MRSISICLAALALSLAAGCNRKPEPPPAPSTAKSHTGPALLARIHFAGAGTVGASTNGSTIKEVWSLPETVQLRDKAITRLIERFSGSFERRHPESESDFVTQLQPLIVDCLEAECLAEWYHSGSPKSDWTLAVRLSDERAGVWQTNLAALNAEWTTKGGDAAPFAFARSGPWLVVASRETVLTATNSPLHRLKSGGIAGADASHWLRVEADLAKLQPQLSLPFGSTNLPSIDLALSGRGDSVRTEVKMRFAEPQSWKPDAWQIPTNTIREPLIGFTAAQNVSSWIGAWDVTRKLEVDPAPDQVYVWSEGRVPVQLYWAAPMRGVTNLLHKIRSTIISNANTKLAEQMLGEIKVLTNGVTITWGHLPLIVPFLQPGIDAGREFLVGGLFPPIPSTNPPPPELIAQLTSRTNLLYYDWEITQSRLYQFRRIAEVFAMVMNRRLTPKDAAFQWLSAVEDRLGESVTEVSVTSARELTFVRKSFIGFTAPEIVSLAYWIDSTDFPALDFRKVFTPAKRMPAPARPPNDAGARNPNRPGPPPLTPPGNVQSQPPIESPAAPKASEPKP